MLKITWVDHHAKPQCPSDPDYPNGIDLDMTRGAARTCEIKLTPYPTKGLGHFIVTCEDCRQRVMVTTAGRPDDPRSIKLACRERIH